MYVCIVLWSFLLVEVVRFRRESMASSSLDAEVDKGGAELVVESSVSLRTSRSDGGGEIGLVCGKP